MEYTDNEGYDVDFMNLVVDKADDLKVIDCDRHFTEFAGVHISKIHQGKLDLMELILPVYRETVFKTLCKKDSPFVYFDAEFIDKNGDSVYIHCTGQNYERSTLCRLTLADISRSKRRAEAVKEQALRLDTLIDMLDGGVCVFKVDDDMHIDITYINDYGCRIFGTTKSAMELGNYRLEQLIHRDDRSAVYQAIGKSLATGDKLEITFKIKSRENIQRRCMLRGGILRYEDEHPVFHAVLTDITK